MNSWLFPPTTREVQFDEKWDFVEKKEKNCESGDHTRGDCWDHVAFDPESRLVVSLVVGKRTDENTLALMRDFHQRTAGRIPRLMTSDGYATYATAIHEVYGEVATPPPTGRPGRPRLPEKVIPKTLVYATVHKERVGGRVVNIRTCVVFGTMAMVLVALLASSVSRVVNTSFVERHNSTDRGRCSRKVRKSYGFSKDWQTHILATQFSYFSYNWCWPVRTMQERDGEGRWHKRTPAMAAGLTDHVWTLHEWLAYPIAQ